jgi:hypothetical protein
VATEEIVLVLAWYFMNVLLLVYFLWHLTWLVLLVRVERSLDSFFRHEGVRGYSTLLLLPAVAGITGGIFGAVISELLSSYERPDRLTWEDVIRITVFLFVGFVAAIALPVWMLNGDRTTKDLRIAAKVHRLAASEFSDQDKDELLAGLDERLQKLAEGQAKGKLQLTFLLLAAASIDVALTIYVVLHGGNWAVVILTGATCIAATLVARVIFRRRWIGRRYADLAAYRPEIEALVPASQTAPVHVVHHHHYQGWAPWAPLSVGLGLGAAIVWIARALSRR